MTANASSDASFKTPTFRTFAPHSISTARSRFRRTMLSRCCSKMAALFPFAAVSRLRVSTVMGAKRIELAGFSDTEVEQLKSFGFFTEIIAWRLRLFLPLEAHTGAEALSRLFLLYPPL